MSVQQGPKNPIFLQNKPQLLAPRIINPTATQASIFFQARRNTFYETSSFLLATLNAIYGEFSDRFQLQMAWVILNYCDSNCFRKRRAQP
jgi:hypothetical protein